MNGINTDDGTADRLEVIDEVTPQQKSRISWMALTGLACGVVGTGIPFMTYARFLHLEFLDERNPGVTAILLICLLCGPILGTFALVAIMRSGGQLWGRRAAIWAVLIWPLIGFLVVGMMLGTSDNRWQNLGIWTLLIGFMAVFYSLLEIATQKGWSAPEDEDKADAHIHAALRGVVILMVLWIVIGTKYPEESAQFVVLMVMWLLCLLVLYHASRACSLKGRVWGEVLMVSGAVVFVTGGMMLVNRLIGE